MIYNFTLHKLTEEQIIQGVVEVDEELKEKVLEILCIKEIPTVIELELRAKKLVNLAKENKIDKILIGSGVPAFNYFLVKELKEQNIAGVYSFSKRVCVETHQEDGGVKKEYLFRHEGFYEV